MQKILVVSYYFPPYGGGSVVRVHNFVKYLPQFGFMPVILTVYPEYWEDTYRDFSLLNEYKPKVLILQTKSLEPKAKKIKNQIYGIKKKNVLDKAIIYTLRIIFKRILLQDRGILWLPHAMKKTSQLIRSTKIDVVFSSGPPFSNHIISYCIAKRFNLSLILDYRDDWVGSNPYSFGIVRDKVEKYIEKNIIKFASKVIYTTRPSGELFHRKFPLESPDKFIYIPNGFDPDYFHFSLRKKTQNTIRFVYTGSLTTKRTPEYFLRALKAIIDENPGIGKNLKVRFIGFSHEKHKTLVGSLELDQIASFETSVSQKEIARILLEESDVCLVFQRDTGGGETAIPGKVYEYLASRKPILCMDDGGATTKFLKDLGVDQDLICNYEDVEKIKNAINKLISDYNEMLSKFSWGENMLSKFNRVKHTEILSKVLQNSIRRD